MGLLGGSAQDLSAWRATSGMGCVLAKGTSGIVAKSQPVDRGS